MSVDLADIALGLPVPSDGPAPLGQMLLARGLLSAVDLERGLAFQERFGGRLGAVLVRIGALPESELLSVLSEQLGLPVLAGGAMPSDPGAILAAMEGSGVPAEWWLDQGAIVWQGAEGQRLDVERAVGRMDCHGEDEGCQQQGIDADRPPMPPD